MDDREVGRFWDENAPDWIRGVRSGWDVYREYVNNPEFFGMLPDLSGLRVLDVGCGEGYNTRKFAELVRAAGPESSASVRPGAVVGVDVSEAMVAAAREHEASDPLGIEYHLASGSDLGQFPDESFDAVLSTMVMMDMPDYAGAVREVRRVLRGGGLFQFSASHPCTMTRLWEWICDDAGQRKGIVAGNYFSLEPTSPEEDVDEWFWGAAPPDERAAGRRFRVPRFFRTLSEYLNPLFEAGLRVDRIAEPHASEAAVGECPDVADTRVVPYFIILQARKTP